MMAYAAQDLYRMEANDWRYEMRREMQEILPGLWLGPYQCSKDLETLKSRRITHILCIRDVNERHIMKIRFPEDFTYHVIEVSESPMQNLIPHFPEAKAFLDSVLAAGGKALVHCNSGISRAPAFVVAYLIMSQGWGYSQAYAFVQNKRFCINPNEGFKYQLKEFEPIWKANNNQEIQQYSVEQISQQGKLKRNVEEEDTEGDSRMVISRH